jgi:hypothetical protein
MNTIYKWDELPEILQICLSYVQNTDEESVADYFLELRDTKLFADAVGKPIKYGVLSVEVTTNY